jgi:hypothetical protein
MISSPFWWVSAYRWPLLALLLVGTLAFAIGLKKQGEPLARAGASIVDYEFAWTKAGAQTVLNSWVGLMQVARKQLQLDSGFLILYPLLLSLACAMLAETPNNLLAAMGIFLSWAVLAAGPLDAIENAALLRMLSIGASDVLAKTAGWCAGLKFTLVYAALGYCLLQGLGLLVAKLRG